MVKQIYNSNQLKLIDLGFNIFPDFKYQSRYKTSVYFLEGGGYIKIGKSKNVFQRLKQHSCVLPFKVKLINWIPHPHTMDFEKWFHMVLLPKNGIDSIKGNEWYPDTPKLRRVLKKYLNRELKWKFE